MLRKFKSVLNSFDLLSRTLLSLFYSINNSSFFCPCRNFKHKTRHENKNNLKYSFFCKHKLLKGILALAICSGICQVTDKITIYKTYLGMSTPEASHIKCMNICMSQCFSMCQTDMFLIQVLVLYVYIHR
jgi:hypothetical protein